MKTKKNVMIFWGALLLLCGIFALVLNLGTILLLAGGMFFLAAGLTMEKWHNRRGVRNMLWGILILTVIILTVYTLIWNYFAFFRQPPDHLDGTVVVLGCKVDGDQPSLMLRRRLEKAREYLEENPKVNCVVSGGQGENEKYTEAYVMKKYLVDHGIAPERIWEEGSSKNTAENLRFSTKVIREEGLNQQLVICTDGFHQLRAYIYAQKNGLSSYAISGRTPFWVVPSYAVREMFAIVKAVIF